ncbi:voltage-dependent T-type calcium channel subunit alpha-1G-like isoform X3 [Panonychus citri]|uniref:voltage-dependent T-type calcium channel subunit alpha-1G-like isoform X3 n=1 Tax=Panonychus citri TaxID=50023 RepID=UPI002306DDEF|nr:voltage-dependent T-type calcium channel subunit alpha-1G-like isoform X3 [Panonychus citri]
MINTWFERISMMAILLNCITLGMYEPCVDEVCHRSQCRALQVFDDMIFLFFAAEMVIKMTAMGIRGSKGAYLSETWNRLDFFIVIAGGFEYINLVGNINLSAIRTVRVLRPLRAINRIPSMRILVMLLLDTLPMLGNVLLLCFFVFFIFGIIGVQLWAGLLRQRCFLDLPANISLPPPIASHYQVMADTEKDYICSLEKDNGMHRCDNLPPFKYNKRECFGEAIPFHHNLPNETWCVNWNRYYTKCKHGIKNPFQGAMSFDNVGMAWTAIFLVISLEGWTEIMYYVQDAHSFWDWLYFVLLIVIGSFFMINLCLVVIATQFSETKKREMERMRQERARLQSNSSLVSGSGSEPTNCYDAIIKYLAHLGRRAKRKVWRYYRDYRRKRRRTHCKAFRSRGQRLEPLCPSKGGNTSCTLAANETTGNSNRPAFVVISRSASDYGKDSTDENQCTSLVNSSGKNCRNSSKDKSADCNVSHRSHHHHHGKHCHHHYHHHHHHHHYHHKSNSKHHHHHQSCKHRHSQSSEHPSCSHLDEGTLETDKLISDEERLLEDNCVDKPVDRMNFISTEQSPCDNINNTLSDNRRNCSIVYNITEDKYKQSTQGDLNCPSSLSNNLGSSSSPSPGSKLNTNNLSSILVNSDQPIDDLTCCPSNGQLLGTTTICKLRKEKSDNFKYLIDQNSSKKSHHQRSHLGPSQSKSPSSSNKQQQTPSGYPSTHLPLSRKLITYQRTNFRHCSAPTLTLFRSQGGSGLVPGLKSGTGVETLERRPSKANAREPGGGNGQAGIEIEPLVNRPVGQQHQADISASDTSLSVCMSGVEMENCKEKRSGSRCSWTGHGVCTDNEDDEDSSDSEESIDSLDDEHLCDCCIDCRCLSCLRSIRVYLRLLVNHRYFQRFIFLGILFNTLSMGIEYHNQPDELTQALEMSNLIFTFLFGIEMALKILAEGCFHYISDGFNVFDGIVVIVSIMELVEDSGSGLSVLRTFRLLRILKLVRFMPALKRQLVIMLRTLDNVAVFFALLVLFIFIFSCLGMHLFGGKFCSKLDGSPCSCEDILNSTVTCICDRKRFDNFLWALVTVFQILTQEDWNVVLFNGMERTTHWAALYFVVLMTFGNYVLFNLLVAILVEGFSQEKDEDKKDSLDGEDEDEEQIKDEKLIYFYNSGDNLEKELHLLTNPPGITPRFLNTNKLDYSFGFESVQHSSTVNPNNLICNVDQNAQFNCDPSSSFPPRIVHTAATPQGSPGPQELSYGHKYLGSSTLALNSSTPPPSAPLPILSMNKSPAKTDQNLPSTSIGRKLSTLTSFMPNLIPGTPFRLSPYSTIRRNSVNKSDYPDRPLISQPMIFERIGVHSHQHQQSTNDQSQQSTNIASTSTNKQQGEVKESKLSSTIRQDENQIDETRRMLIKSNESNFDQSLNWPSSPCPQSKQQLTENHLNSSSSLINRPSSKQCNGCLSTNNQQSNQLIDSQVAVTSTVVSFTPTLTGYQINNNNGQRKLSFNSSPTSPPPPPGTTVFFPGSSHEILTSGHDESKRGSQGPIVTPRSSLSLKSPNDSLSSPSPGHYSGDKRYSLVHEIKAMSLGNSLSGVFYCSSLIARKYSSEGEPTTPCPPPSQQQPSLTPITPPPSGPIINQETLNNCNHLPNETSVTPTAVDSMSKRGGSGGGGGGGRDSRSSKSVRIEGGKSEGGTTTTSSTNKKKGASPVDASSGGSYPVTSTGISGGGEFNNNNNLTVGGLQERKFCAYFKWYDWMSKRDNCSLFIFPPENRIRINCAIITEHRCFDYVILIFISLNCITLAMERPKIPPWSLEREMLTAANYVFTVVFALEMALKVIANGLWYGDNAYFTSGWNVMDGILVGVSLFDLFLSFIAQKSPRIFGILRVFRLLRSLRPLRVINRAPGLKLVVQTLLSSLRPIGNIVLICCTFFIIFGILGVQLFKGALFYCEGPDVRFIRNRTDCLSDPRNRWVNRKYNFDNLGQALMALFVLSSKDGWVNIMYTGLDAVGVDQQPRENYNEWRLLYFISFLLLVAFFVLNMFVGVVVENFHRCREEQEKEERARRAEKRARKLEKRRRSMPLILKLEMVFEFPISIYNFLKFLVTTTHFRIMHVIDISHGSTGDATTSNLNLTAYPNNLSAHNYYYFNSRQNKFISRPISKRNVDDDEDDEEEDDIGNNNNYTRFKLLGTSTLTAACYLGSSNQLTGVHSSSSSINSEMREPPYYIGYGPFRLKVHNMVTGKYFDAIIAGVICLNVITMSLEHYQMPWELEYSLKMFNFVFTSVFVCEALMKLYALGIRRYLKDQWNQLDVMIVIMSIVGIILEEMESELIPINPTIIRVMRVARIARVLKLLKMAKGMRALLNTVMQALPQVGNLGLLFFLLFFIFAALGVELFGRLECDDDHPCQGLSEHAHFQNFGMAFLTLFRVATGDNWNGVMKDTLRDQCDSSRDCLRNCCVSPIIAPLYFVIFVLLAQFVLVNVVVAVLMKHLEESHKNMEEDEDYEIDMEIARELAAEKKALEDAIERKKRDEELRRRKSALYRVSSLPANFKFHFSDDLLLFGGDGESDEDADNERRGGNGNGGGAGQISMNCFQEPFNLPGHHQLPGSNSHFNHQEYEKNEVRGYNLIRLLDNNCDYSSQGGLWRRPSDGPFIQIDTIEDEVNDNVNCGQELVSSPNDYDRSSQPFLNEYPSGLTVSRKLSDVTIVDEESSLLTQCLLPSYPEFTLEPDAASVESLTWSGEASGSDHSLNSSTSDHQVNQQSTEPQQQQQHESSL